MTRLGAAILLMLALAAPAGAVTYTLAPLAYQTVFDSNGDPVSGAKICTYTAGTTTPVTTYSDATGTTNTNPIVADSAGRFVAFLIPGVSYKFTFQTSSGTANTCDGTVIRTVDVVGAVPASAASIDVTGTAGEALTAGQCVYLSDGSGSKTAGQWFKCDSTNAYSSSTAFEVGIVPNAISSAASGTIRLSGQVTGLSSLTIGAQHYASTSGAITATAPGNRRALGQADSTTSLIVTPNPVLPIQNWVNDFRLTLTTATPITTADVSGASAVTIYASPLTGNRIDLPDSSGNPVRVTSTEFSIAVPATTSQMYDVFVYNNAGVATLELLAWTNDTTRATTVIRTTNGRYFKNGDNTRLYVGSCRTTTVSGQTEDSATKRYIWNYYNRSRRLLQRTESTASWTYNTATWRQANAAAANQVDVVIGIAESTLTLTVTGLVVSSGANGGQDIGIGEDSTTTVITANSVVWGQALNITIPVTATVTKMPAVGRHFYSWNEANSATTTSTWYGTQTTVGGLYANSGLSGSIEQD